MCKRVKLVFEGHIKPGYCLPMFKAKQCPVPFYNMWLILVTRYLLSKRRIKVTMLYANGVIVIRLSQWEFALSQSRNGNIYLNLNVLQLTRMRFPSVFLQIVLQRQKDSTQLKWLWGRWWGVQYETSEVQWVQLTRGPLE